jgi:trehalose/maltose transport system permease protein
MAPPLLAQGEYSMSTAQGQPATTPTARGKPAARGSELQRSQTRLAWMLLAPALILIAFIALWPLAQTIWASFTNARLGSTQPTRFVGLSNYALLIRDSFWWNAVWVTIRFALITVVFEFILGMLVALVIQQQFQGPGPDAHRDAGAVGHSHDGVGPDVELDV